MINPINKGQADENVGGKPRFAGQGLDLSFKNKTLPDETADVFQDFRQIAAAFPLDGDGEHKKFQIVAVDARRQDFARPPRSPADS